LTFASTFTIIHFAMTPDRYSNFATLSRDQRAGLDFAVRVRRGSSGIAVLAPHGGRIEPGTSEIARALAGGDHTLYEFAGLKPAGNLALHLRSERFDEPRALEVIAGSRFLIVVHGCTGTEEILQVGGSFPFKQELIQTLTGFDWAVEKHPRFRGHHPNNLCNRLGPGRGLQLEVSAALRRRLTADGTSAAPGTDRSGSLADLAAAVNGCLGRAPRANPWCRLPALCIHEGHQEHEGNGPGKFL